ncbi:GlsB/YeaQ/YmgE family stress response membrane protein [Pantanalinema rosaneae CENA516]|uniref:GlsB/YeaQ/YmgE family stress response membrane protein n=1 Tax=Pantanalinema rosaneae TaxID=1620701 RepID=UPI003D6E99CE
MGILAWIVLGLLAGAIAKAIYPGYQSSSILGTMLLGIIGAFVGGTLYTLLTTGSFVLTGVGFSFGGLLIAIIGSVIALWLYYAIVSRRVY